MISIDSIINKNISNDQIDNLENNDKINLLINHIDRN